jgi:diguanylate cyclase (GGDEF)-like protein/PAS domain S-box-containing protein
LEAKFVTRLLQIKEWRLSAVVSAITVLATELIVSAMSLLLNGKLSYDYLLTGLVASVIVAPPGVLFMSYLISEISKGRQRLESNTLRAENHLRITIENAHMLVWELNLPDGTLQYDDTMLKLLDIATDTPPHTVPDWLKLVHPDERAVFMVKFQAAMQAGDPLFDLEYRCAQGAGQWGWVHTKGRVIQRDAAGNPILAIGSTMNITNRKKAESEFRDAQRRFELIFNNNPDVMVISRMPAGIITNVNDAFVANTGYSRAEAIGNSTVGLAFWSADDRQRMTDAIRQQGYCRNMEFEFRLKDGKTRTGSISAVITSLQGIPHLVSTVHDITEHKLAELALRTSEEHAHNLASMLRLMCDNVPDMIWAKDMEMNYIFANKAICQQLLNAADTEEPVGRDDLFFALRERNRHTEDPHWHTFGELCQDSDAITLALGKPAQFDEFGNVQGKFIFLDVHKAPFVNEKGQVIGVVGSARNVTEQRAAEERLRLASLVLENSSEALLVTDADNLIVDINPAFTRMTGYELSEISGKTPALLHSGRQGSDFYAEMWQQINRTGRWQGEIWNRRKNGEIFAEWLTINTIRHGNGSVHRRVALFSDITEKKKSEELIWTQANFDTLTKLPNRRMFRDRLAHDLKKAPRAGQKLALLFLDLDHFKEVNDTLGHDCGDLLLIEAARRITACVRESDTVARLGGDEFTIILAELDDTSRIEQLAEQIIHSLSLPFRLNDETAYVTASVGITIYPDDAMDIEDMLKNADQAMFVSKRAGRNRFSFFTNAMQEAAQHRLHIINDLRIAVANQQFQLYFQPITELAGGKLRKAEALLRWFHPTRGLISPAEFIPLAEESGLIHEIGAWVFAEAVKQAQRWQADYGLDFQISVNMSPVQMQAAHSNVQWFHQLDKLGLSGHNFVFEITEGLLLDTSSNVTNQLLAFRDAGIQVAIDDFGTGYSALSYLKKMDIDYLKIDQSFTRNLAADSSDMALSEAIIVMAHKLGLKVIAEGVETEQQHQLLHAVGCDYGQGYYYSKPLDRQTFEQWLKNQKTPADNLPDFSI